MGRALAKLRAHPLHISLLAAIGLVLGWLVLTKSVPFALAPSDPDRALALSAHNPAALLAKARELREALLLQSSRAAESAPATGSSGVKVSAAPQKDDAVSRPTEAENKGGSSEEAGERVELRQRIRSLANAAISKDPLNAEAFRLLAETADDSEEVRNLMRQAANRSRRETVALFWLLNDSFYRKDYQAILSYADVILRTRPELSNYVFNYVMLAAEDPAVLPLAVQLLEKKPNWRRGFFEALPRNVRLEGAPLKLVNALKESGSPPSDAELAPYLEALVYKNRIDIAYNIWLQFQPADETANSGLITNRNFQSPPSGSPFDWRISQGVNAIAEIVPVRRGNEGVLHVSFGSGRVKFPTLSQVAVLPPGNYHLSGKLRGHVAAKRGLRWQLLCAPGSQTVLGQTDMLMGDAPEWRLFEMQAKVPEDKECVGQTLRLVHDSRSASEEFISGEIWFTELRLDKIEQ